MMCKYNVKEEAKPLLASILDKLACKLAEESGVNREEVLITSVDFGHDE